MQEAVVNVISNVDCGDYLTRNTSSNAIKKIKLKQTLAKGVNDQLICTVGIRNGTVYSVGAHTASYYFKIHVAV